MSATDLALILLIFGEFFVFLAIANYLEKRGKKRKKKETRDFPFYEGVWTKSKLVYTVYPDNLEMFAPTSRIEIQEKQRPK